MDADEEINILPTHLSNEMRYNDVLKIVNKIV